MAPLIGPNKLEEFDILLTFSSMKSSEISLKDKFVKFNFSVAH
jgi:hypothetical protein